MAHHKEVAFRPASAAVVTISDTRTPDTDTSGNLIEEMLREAGHRVVSRDLIKDELEVIRARVRALLDARQSSFIILTGGTGLSQRDVTPEAIQPLFTKSIPGFGELFRMLSYDDVGTATIQSRAEAGLCGHAVVMALPGSTNACRLAMDKIIIPQMDNRNRPCSFRTIIPDLPG
jgi:molybdenum cofactor biosynthesis protein B